MSSSADTSSLSVTKEERSSSSVKTFLSKGHIPETRKPDTMLDGVKALG